MERKLETFLTLCETLNYRRAAERLHLTQPAVTKQIQALEAEYGAVLFQYDGRRLHKTAKGELLELHAIAQRYNHQKLMQAMQAAPPVALRIGATKTIGDYILGPAIRRFLDAPDHQLQFLVDNTAALLHRLEQGELDFVVLAALEIDTGFNVNVLTGSDGVLRGAPGGHPDAAAGSKCCIIVTPLVRGRMATVCEHVVTVTTPGDCVDVLVTDYGIAVNPQRPDLIECLDAAGIPHVPIEALQKKAYSLVGTPDDLEWEDQVVAVLEARDGTILDVVRKIKPLKL